MQPVRPTTLRVEAHAVPALGAAFQAAADKMHDALVEVRSSGFVFEPWLGDPASQQMVNHYREVAVEGPHSALRALTAYHEELQRIADTLIQMSKNYADTEVQIVTDLHGGSLTAAQGATVHGPLHAGAPLT